MDSLSKIKTFNNGFKLLVLPQSLVSQYKKINRLKEQERKIKLMLTHKLLNKISPKQNKVLRNLKHGFKN